MLSLFLLLIIAAVALGIIGVVVHGLLWLLAIGVVVFLVDFVLLGVNLRGRRRHPVR